MRHIVKYIVFFVLLGVTYSCTTKTIQKAEYPFNAIVSKLDSISVFVDYDKNDSTFIRLFVTPDEGNHYFYSDTLNRLQIAKYGWKGDTIVEMKSKILEETDWEYFTLDSVSIKKILIEDTPYLYFEATINCMGNAVVTSIINLHLVNLTTFENYKLSYEGIHTFRCSDDNVEGDFMENNLKNENPQMYNELMSLSKKSRLIYHKSKEEENPLHYLNYEEKWYKDNNVNNVLSHGHADITVPIKSTYYETNLFNLYDQSVADEDGAYVENDYFQVFGVLCGNLIGYDKHKQKYFPILIEGCIAGCQKELEFISNDSLQIVYSFDNDTTIIDLKKDFIFDAKDGN